MINFANVATSFLSLTQYFAPIMVVQKEHRVDTYMKVRYHWFFIHTWVSFTKWTTLQEHDSRTLDLIDWTNQVSLALGLDMQSTFSLPIDSFMKATDIAQSFLHQVRLLKKQ